MHRGVSKFGNGGGENFFFLVLFALESVCYRHVHWNGNDAGSFGESVWGMENNMRGDYPFKRYALIEVPSSFITFGRWWKEGSSLTRLGMGFIPERAVTMSWKSFHSEWWIAVYGLLR